MPRFHCPIPLASGQTVDLPASAARHVQVLRMQPGMALTLFNGEGENTEYLNEMIQFLQNLFKTACRQMWI